MANRHAQDFPNNPADCELGTYDCQLPVAGPAAVIGCQGLG